MSLPPVVALDIGTSKVCALVGETREDGNVMIIGLGTCRSAGVRKGVIHDIEQVANCVGTVIEDAEQSSDVKIRQVYLSVSGGHIQSMINPGTTPIFDPRTGVTSDDIDSVQDIANSVNLPHDREIIHSIRQKYSVDNHHNVINPEGMHGGKLSLNMLLVHGSRNLLNDILKAVVSVGLKVADVMFDGLCPTLSVLTPEQKKSGVCVIDLGGGTSSYAIYTDETVAAVGALAIGGDHITNDIAIGFNLSHKQADSLKYEHGLYQARHFQQIAVPAEVGFSACSIVASDLNAVIKARTEETFTLIKNDLEKKSVLGQLAAGIFLTGGGAHLRGIENFASDIFNMPCAIGKPRKFSGMASVYEMPEYAVALGMIKHAAAGQIAQSAHKRSLVGWLRRFFGARD